MTCWVGMMILECMRGILSKVTRKIQRVSPEKNINYIDVDAAGIVVITLLHYCDSIELGAITNEK